MSAGVRALGLFSRLPDPAGLREALQSMGPPFIKLGQFLALRPDLMKQEYCDELLRLTDDAPPFEWAAARRIIEEDLGGAIESKFGRIDSTPIAAASLAQVHLARTPENELVAVKVQRPDAAASMKRSLKRERLLKRLFSMTEATAIVPPDEMLDELARWLATELDMGIELSNLTRMHDLARADGHAIQMVPRPYPALSGRRVITAEFLSGVPLSEILRKLRGDRGAEAVAKLGFDREILAEHLVEAILTQIFRFQFFHADPHPGNLVAMPGNTIGFVDLALTDSLTPTHRRSTSEYLTAIYSRDVDAMMRAMLDVLVPSERADIDRFKRAFVDETDRWMRERESRLASGESASPLRQYMVGVVTMARQAGLRVPAGLLSMYRALLTAETVAEKLGGKAALSSMGERFFKRFQLQEAIASLDSAQLLAMGMSVLNLAKSGPGQVHRLLSDLADDKLVLSVRTQESPADKRDADARAKLVTMGAVSIAVAVLIAGVGSRTILGIPVSYGLGPILAIIYLWMVVVWRRMS